MKISFGIKIWGVWVFHIRIEFLDFEKTDIEIENDRYLERMKK